MIFIASLKIREMLPLLKIWNTDGINISKKKEININLDALPKGVYFVQLISDKAQNTQRIIKP